VILGIIQNRITLHDEVQPASSRRKAGAGGLCELDLPISLKELNVPKNDLEAISDVIIKQHQELYGLPTYSPRKPSPENILRFLDEMWEGGILPEDYSSRQSGRQTIRH